jgi:hypothetical protein
MKEEGSCPPSSAKMMAKKCICHIPKPNPDIIVISYISCWIEVEGMRHITEEMPGDGSSSSERSR